MIKQNAKILIVDDDPDILATAQVFLKQHFATILIEQNPDKIFKQLADIAIDLIMLDMNFKKGDEDGHEGLNYLQKIVEKQPGTAVIMMTAYGEIHLAIEAMKHGAADFVLKPWKNDQLLRIVTNALKLNAVASSQSPENQSGLIGVSKPWSQIVDIIDKVASTDANLLLTGENGTGKSLIAKQIHTLSARTPERFVSVDLGSINEHLFESELFGHVKGAFTDAKDHRVGRFEEANGGTLFLDEVANLSTRSQAKLLSALQNNQIQKVGSNTPINVDIRLISATNANVGDLVAAGRFRQDLLYRINTIEINIPALRERKEDIIPLANHFMQIYSKKYGYATSKLDRNVVQHLEKYSWPGNVRELEHTIERAVIMSSDGHVKLSDFSLSGIGSGHETENSLNLKDNEKRLIMRALEENGGNVTHAAKALGIDRLALYRRMEKYGL